MLYKKRHIFLVTDCRDEHGTTRHLKHPSTAAAVHQQNLKVLNCKVSLFVLQWKSITKPLQHALCQRGTEEPNKRTLNLNQLQYPWAFPESVHFISSLLIRCDLKIRVCISKATLLVPVNGLLWNLWLKKREKSGFFYKICSLNV